MRTTLTLEPDVAMRVQKLVNERNMTLKDVVNRALRSGLSEVETPPKRKPVKLKTYAMGLIVPPGVDPTKLGQYADQLEDEYILAKMRRDRSRR